MEASDGEEEKSQKGSEEKEEVDSTRRPARPQETRSRNAGRENRPGKLRRNRQRQNGNGGLTDLLLGPAPGKSRPPPPEMVSSGAPGVVCEEVLGSAPGA